MPIIVVETTVDLQTIIFYETGLKAISIVILSLYRGSDRLADRDISPLTDDRRNLDYA